MAPKASTRERRAPRERILRAAAKLLRTRGIEAVTTRGVAEAAGVQAPALYRLFGDKDGLIEAVAEYEARRYVEEKGRDEETADALADLRSSWERNVRFGIDNPALFVLLTDPVRVARSPVSAAGIEHLRRLVRRVAATGRLRVPEDRAVATIWAAGLGAVFVHLATAPEERDPELSSVLFEAVTREILTDQDAAVEDPVAAAAVTLAAALPRLAIYTEGESALLAELLERAIRDGSPPAA